MFPQSLQNSAGRRRQPAVDKFRQCSERRMGKIAFQMTPDPGNQIQVAEFAVANREAGKHTDDPQVPLGSADRQMPQQIRLVDSGLHAIPADRPFAHCVRDIAPRIFQNRHQVISGVTESRVLKVNQADAAHALAFGQPNKVFGMVIAVQEHRRAAEAGDQIANCCEKPVGNIGGHRFGN